MDILSTITNLVGSPRFIFYFILLKQCWSVGLYISLEGSCLSPLFSLLVEFLVLTIFPLSCTELPFL